MTIVSFACCVGMGRGGDRNILGNEVNGTDIYPVYCLFDSFIKMRCSKKILISE